MKNSIDAYPLTWPFGIPRARARTYSRFGERSIAAARDLLKEELRKLGASELIISSNVKPVRGEIPHDAKQPKDTGIAVYFKLKGSTRSFSCDKYLCLEDNLYAVALTIEAMRGMDRWGCSDMLQRVFQGFTALPPPSDGSGSPWWEVLKIARDLKLEAIEAQYRHLAMIHHPDRPGGSTAKMANLARAIEEARTEKRGA